MIEILQEATVSATHAGLQLFYGEIVRSGMELGLAAAPAAMGITVHCLGLWPILIFIIWVTMSSDWTWYRRFLVSVFGAAVLVGWNLIRLIVLFAVLNGAPGYFTVLHEVLFPLLFVAIVAGIWLACRPGVWRINRGRRQPYSVTSSSRP